MQCPNCSNPMQESKKYEVYIDYCPTCKGVWLDRGEIDKIANIQSRYEEEHYQKYHRDRRDYDDDDYYNRRRRRGGGGRDSLVTYSTLINSATECMFRIVTFFLLLIFIIKMSQHLRNLRSYFYKQIFNKKNFYCYIVPLP